MMQSNNNPHDPYRLCAVCKERHLFDGQLCNRCAKVFSLEIVIPFGCRNFNFENFKITPANQNAYQKAKAFTSINKSLFIFGKETGCGKTHLQISSLRESLKQFKKSKYINYTELVLLERKQYQTKEDAAAETIDECLNCKRLYIDDLFAERITEQSLQVLYSILDNAILNAKPQIFLTSNFTLEQIGDKADRIASRIVRLCGTENIIANMENDWSLKNKGGKIG